MTKEESEYIVTKNGKEIFRGTNFQCYKFLLDNQPFSSHFAAKNGWNIKGVKNEAKNEVFKIHV